MNDAGLSQAAGRRAAKEMRPRRPLFQKYFVVLFGAVIVPLVIGGASDAWFGYRDQTASISNMLGVEAKAAAGEIRSFLEGIVDQLKGSPSVFNVSSAWTSQRQHWGWLA